MTHGLATIDRHRARRRLDRVGSGWAHSQAEYGGVTLISGSSGEGVSASLSIRASSGTRGGGIFYLSTGTPRAAPRTRGAEDWYDRVLALVEAEDVDGARALLRAAADVGVSDSRLARWTRILDPDGRVRERADIRLDPEEHAENSRYLVEHAARHAGTWLALKGGTLVASGSSRRDVDRMARERSPGRVMLVWVPPRQGSEG